ncbi:MAG TPA: hypothetical protein VFE58_02785 [Tepidisphaeraceae bacterium]|nr:hypothetical protein [Tepidisphaeraceae bacterium]
MDQLEGSDQVPEVGVSQVAVWAGARSGRSERAEMEVLVRGLGDLFVDWDLAAAGEEGER